MDDGEVISRAMPLVGDRVTVVVDAERFEGDENISYFEQELRERRIQLGIAWCTGSVSNERGHIVALFPHARRQDNMTVFLVNVDGRGLIAISAMGIKLRLHCGMHVQIVPRRTIELKAWRLAGTTAFPALNTIVPAEDVSTCTGRIEISVSHPSIKGQFVWLVHLDETDDVFTVVHSVDLIPWSAKKGGKRPRGARQIVAMVPATSLLRPVSADYEFQGFGSEGVRHNVDTDVGYIERCARSKATTTDTVYLQHFFLAPHDDDMEYQ